MAERKMKDSGVEWIGQIPNTWAVSATKHLCTNIFAGGTPDTTKSEFWDGEIPWLPSGACKNNVIKNYEKTITDLGYRSSSTKFIKPNTTIMAMTGATCAMVGYTTFLTCANQSVTAFIENKDKVNSKFLFYSLFAAKDEILTHQTGGAQAGINVQDCKSYIVPITNIVEQKKIADFLDTKCFEIDALSKDIEKEIETLEEYKKSEISETVIKGLNPNAEVKDSEELVGLIPVHYKKGRVKNVSTLITDGAHITPDTSEEKYRFLSVTDMDEYGELDFEHCLRITEQQYLSFVRTGCKPIVNDVLISKDGTVGKTTVITSGIDFVVASSLVIIRPNLDKMVPQYLRYCLMTGFVQEQLQALLAGSALKRVSVNKNANLKIIYTPSISEQIEIVDHLNERCKLINSLIEDKRKQLVTIQEYKKALIYEYITGKKEVV